MDDVSHFSSAEISRFIDNNHASRNEGNVIERQFRVALKGDSKPAIMSLVEFENVFQLFYRPHLCFTSLVQFREVLNQCPYILRSRWLAEDNYMWQETYKTQIMQGMTADVYVKWIDASIGYGLFAYETLPKGTYIGEYTGLVCQMTHLHPNKNPYCFHYPTRFWSWKYFMIDASRAGNLMRFINHSKRPNLQPLCTVDRNLLHQIFITNQVISKGSQLTFNYGL